MLKVIISPRALRELNRIPAKERNRLKQKIRALASGPQARHAWAKPLTGRPGLRIRQGDYRVIVMIDQEAQTLAAIEAGHRKEIYR